MKHRHSKADAVEDSLTDPGRAERTVIISKCMLNGELAWQLPPLMTSKAVKVWLVL